MGFIEKENKTYAIITADGALRIQTNEQDPNAEKRVIEKDDGSKIVKWELVKKGYKGKIECISFREADFGKMMNIAFVKERANEPQVVLSLNTDIDFAKDIMKKLPNVDLKEELSLSPFSFKNDNDKPVKGITIWQNGEKALNFFRKFDKDGKNGENVNGMPDPDNNGKGFDRDDWIMYFTKVKKFLIKFTEDNIIPTLETIDHKQPEAQEELNIEKVEFQDMDGEEMLDEINKKK